MDDQLSERMKKYVSYRSMCNFLRHFDEIKAEKARMRVRELLSDYVEEVRSQGYDFTRGPGSLQLGRKYLSPLTDFYKEDSNFWPIYQLKTTVLFGLLLDGVLYLTGLSNKIFHLPLVTGVFLLYYLFIKIFKEPQGRVAGLFY